MTDPVLINLDLLRGHLRHRVALARYTSWRVGGPAERFYEPADLDDLCAFLRQLPHEEPVLFIGLGSNLLVKDGGVRGTVVYLHGLLADLRVVARDDFPEFAQLLRESDRVIYAEVGVSSPKLARFAANEGLAGAEFLAGIPGTIGGALAMNAGCHGFETWGAVLQVMTVDRGGHLHLRPHEAFDVGYRSVRFIAGEEEWFIAAWLRFAQGTVVADTRVDAKAEIKRMLDRRAATQPLTLPNAGSVFRNPDGDHAARLIESCGLKAMRIGDAQVSEKHANFIVNLGHARAADIEALIQQVQAAVKAQTGIYLVREVRIVGEAI
ncbi:MAG: UDP-N-acetylmuramate dehydrogenase [Betaproteobacteria bacterium]|nr:MAG: UDP-N-acetylmuramate dehydrogenase [Betaproteobacteria bacterium]